MLTQTQITYFTEAFEKVVVATVQGNNEYIDKLRADMKAYYIGNVEMTEDNQNEVNKIYETAKGF